MILADEPTAALDAENGKAVMELLAEVAKDTKRGVLAVTHDHRTLEYADRIVRIEDGRIVGRAPPPGCRRADAGGRGGLGRSPLSSVQRDPPSSRKDCTFSDIATP